MSFGRRIRRLMESEGVIETVNTVIGGINDGTFDARTISFRDLAQGIMGDDWASRLSAFNANTWRLRESAGGDADLTMRTLASGAGEAVDASAFADITGQLLINEIRAKFNSPAFVADRLFKTVPITNGNLGTQITPWLSDVLATDMGEKIQPGMPYGHTKFVEQYQQFPAPEKYGQICSVTMEMLFSDLTSQALDSAGSVGRALRYLKEQKQWDVALGIVNNYKFGNETALTAYNTYQTAGALWTNAISDELIVDWTNINNLEQLFYKMVDPATGRRIFVQPKILVAMPQNKYNAKRVVNATETRSGDITTGAGNQVVAANPLDRTYEVLTSPIAYERLVTSGVNSVKAGNYWFLVDPDMAFVWREVYGLRTETAPKGNPLEFNQDIATQVKAGWFGVAAVNSPYHTAEGIDA